MKSSDLTQRSNVAALAEHASPPTGLEPGSVRRFSWQESLQVQVDNLRQMAEEVDESEVSQAIDMIRRCRGLLVFSGVGQNLLLAGKAAATFSSLSLRAVSADPISALHGGMGLLRPDDLLILISKSGETAELLRFQEACAHVGFVNTLAIHSAPGSTIAMRSRHSVYLPIAGEADHLDLAPTASSVCLLGFLQSLASQLASEAGLTQAAFRRTHPGGTLGLDPARSR